MLSSIKDKVCTGERASLHVSLFLRFLLSWKVRWLQFRGWVLFCCACVLLLPVDCKSTGSLAMGSPQRTLYSKRRTNNGDLDPWDPPPLPNHIPNIGIESILSDEAHVHISNVCGHWPGRGSHCIPKLSLKIKGLRESSLIYFFHLLVTTDTT